jgi:hypothetical protein
VFVARDAVVVDVVVRGRVVCLVVVVVAEAMGLDLAAASATAAGAGVWIATCAPVAGSLAGFVVAVCSAATLAAFRPAARPA